MTKRSYYAPEGGLPPQTQLLTDRAMFTEAYAVIPKGTMSDIVASLLPFWDKARFWVLSRPLSGFAETFSQYIAEVQPGGHFFAAQHTMERFQTAFYEPFSSDWSNFGQWTENGALSADARATGIWKERLAAHTPVELPGDRLARLDAFIAEKTAAGGAPPFD